MAAPQHPWRVLLNKERANEERANETQRRRSRSPDRRDRYEEDSRSRSRDRYRSNRRERSPTNGHYAERDSRAPARSYPEHHSGGKEAMVTNVKENSKQECRVYIGNLPYDVKWHALKDFMKEGVFSCVSSLLIITKR